MLESLFEMNFYKYGVYSELEIMDYLVCECNFKYFIYGAGERGKLMCDWCKKTYGIEPEFFVDKSPKSLSYRDIKIISLSEYEKISREGIFIAVVSPLCYKNEPKEHTRICNFLSENNAKLIIDGGNVLSPFKPGWPPEYFKDNLAKFEVTYKHLADDVSKDTFYNYLKTYITGRRYEGKTFPEKYKYWGIDSPDYRMFCLTDQEVLLNIGASCGDTLFQYLKCKNPFSKIIAVEPEDYDRLKCAVSCLDQKVKVKIQIDEIYLGKKGNTIDNLYSDQNISLINMDIEGAELDVLYSGVYTIRKYRPILAVCAYHKRDDLVKIPEFIDQNLNDYILTLRKYPSNYFDYFDGIQQINELVLYAIPKERYIKYLE